MTQRILTLRDAYNDQPFAGAGTSLYATVGSSVQYRNLRLLGRRRRQSRSHRIKGSGGNHDIAAASVLKTARRASVTDPTASINWNIPAAMASQAVTWDVRKFDSHVEHESDNFRTVTTGLDANRDLIQEILGTATLLDQEQRDGGVVRLRFVYHANRDGVQPTVFRAARTAGPSSPADATVTHDNVLPRVIEIDTPALLDSAPYTYTISAENSGATVTKDLATGVTVNADASGPAAPTGGSTRAV